MSFAILLLLVVAAGMLVVGLVGLVLVILGIVKRSAVMGVIGGVCLLPLIVIVVLAVPMGLWVCASAPHHRLHRVPGAPSVVTAPGFSEGARFHSVDPHHARLTVGGVEIAIEEPGGTATSSGTQIGRTWGEGFHVRHEVTVGDVRLVVAGENGRLALSVDGTDYGRVRPGDSVRITASREVIVNGERRGPGDDMPPEGPRL